jgi:hypothetical protein
MSIIEPVHDDDGLGPTNRSFGLTFCVLSVVVCLAPLWHGGTPRAWALALAAAFGLLAWLWPAALGPANRVWTRVGLMLHRVVNPVVMAVLFYVVVTPFGLAMRMFGKGLRRRLRPDAAATTYWIIRGTRSRMDQQF